MSDPIKRYVFLRMKLTALRCFIPAVPVTLLFLIAALRYDALEYDLLFALLPLAIAAIAMCISMYQPVRFLRMVRKQEAMFGVTFGEKKFAPLYPRTPYHASPDWFICMGSWGFYRGYIDKLTQQTRGGGTPAINYYAKIMTTDGKIYRLICQRLETVLQLVAGNRQISIAPVRHGQGRFLCFCCRGDHWSPAGWNNPSGFAGSQPPPFTQGRLCKPAP